MVPFAGWNMPVQYAGISSEHLAVRSSCGIFDISHMGEFFVSGPDATAWLDSLLTNRAASLNPGQGQYTLLLNEKGGVIDDLIAYRLDHDQWFLVVNAGRLDEDRAWFSQHATPGVSFLDDSPAWAAMAIQGPLAPQIFHAITEGTASLPPRNGIAKLSLNGSTCIVCRTGYTGEDGFEFFTPAADGPAWFQKAVAAGATPCGLGARDTLRLEMGYPLNGNDLSYDRSPLEAGLGFFVSLDKGPFIGRDTLLAQYPVFHNDTPVGELSSGGISPSLSAGIAMAYLPPALATPGTQLEIEIRGKKWPAESVKKPFYRKPPSD
jgi:aminomethyltransferase